MRKTCIALLITFALPTIALLISACTGTQAELSEQAVTQHTFTSRTPTFTPTPRGAIIPTRAPTSTPTVPVPTDTPSVDCIIGGILGQWISYGDEVQGEITNEADRAIFCFTGNAGDWVSLIMTATSGNLDTYITLVLLEGELMVAWNDDARPAILNSSLEHVYLPHDGPYGVIAGRYEGEGSFLLRLDIDGPPFPDLPGTALPLIAEDSGSVLRTGAIMPLRFAVGDALVGERADIRVQAFISYDLSSIPEQASLNDAKLVVTNCQVIGEPFDEFGSAAIEWLPYGTLDPSDYGERALGAILVAQLDGCPESPIGVRSMIQMAMERGYDRWQIKVDFTGRELRSNNRTDALVFGSWPVLFVDY